MSDRYEFFRDKHPDEKMLVRGETVLQRDGWLPTDELLIDTAASLLAGFLHGQIEPNLEVLTATAKRLISRDVPTFPQDARVWNDPYHDIAQQPVPQLIWVDPGRVFPNREYKDKGDWTRSRDASPAGRNDPALGLAEFARRIAREKGDVRGLAELLGPEDNVVYVDLDGWQTPLGAFFRVSLNGNHRTAAFAILGAPCIPATVHWKAGPYSASSSTDVAADEMLCAYRTLLHCYGVASYPDPESIIANDDQIVSEWPFLIDSADSAARSLPILERIAGRRHDEPIGRLPRELFDNEDALLTAGRRTREALERNRRSIDGNGLKAILQRVGLLR